MRRLPDYPKPEWVSRFGDWVREKAEAGAADEIADYLNRAPHARENHPSDDHFLPLPFAMGAGGEGARGKRVHASEQSGVMLMDAYTFG